MTLAPEVAPTPAAAIPADLPGKVDAHMRSHFPEDVDAGGWICARDYRDNTAVVVWRSSGNAELLPGGARAVLIAKWHMSLQNAGFVSEPRTDMEVFGRPDEQSDDGRARWLHITGWDAALVVRPRSLVQLGLQLRQNLAELHRSRRRGQGDVAPSRPPVRVDVLELPEGDDCNGTGLEP